jgi:hypothetical protein
MEEDHAGSRVRLTEFRHRQIYGKNVQTFDWLEPSHVMIVKLGFLSGALKLKLK